MSCQNCQISRNTADNDSFHLLSKKQAIRRSYFYQEGIHKLPPLHIFRFFKDFINATCEQETALRQCIALTAENHFESAKCFFQRYILSRHTCKLLCNRETLRKETLNLTCAVNGQFIFFRQFVHTHNGNDILQFFVSLQYMLYRTGNFIMLGSNNFR